jgi:hypothetical protein
LEVGFGEVAGLRWTIILGHNSRLPKACARTLRANYALKNRLAWRFSFHFSAMHVRGDFLAVRLVLTTGAARNVSGSLTHWGRFSDSEVP